MKDKKGRLQSILMILPNLGLFLLVSVYPVIWALQYMFFNYNGIHDRRFVGLENFVRVFTDDPVFWNSVRNTFVIAAGQIAIIIPVAFLVAYLINKPKRLYAGIQAIIFSPTIMSSSVMALVFFLLLNFASGELNRVLVNIGLISAPLNWLGVDMVMITVILVGVWGGLGNYMVYFLAGLQQIDLTLYESAEMDGVNRWQRMWYITLPLLGPVLKIILMFIIVNSLQDFQSIMVLTGGGPFGRTNVMFLYVFSLYFPTTDAGVFRPQFGYGAAVSVVAAGIIGVVTLLYLRLSKKLDEIY